VCAVVRLPSMHLPRMASLMPSPGSSFCSCWHFAGENRSTGRIWRTGDDMGSFALPARVVVPLPSPPRAPPFDRALLLPLPLVHLLLHAGRAARRCMEGHHKTMAVGERGAVGKMCVRCRPEPGEIPNRQLWGVTRAHA